MALNHAPNLLKMSECMPRIEMTQRQTLDLNAAARHSRVTWRRSFQKAMNVIYPSQKKATAKFKEQLNKVKDELGAMRAGMYMLVWNAVLTKLMGDHPDQSFDDVDSKGLPFRYTNRIVSAYGQPYVLVLTMRMLWPRVGGKKGGSFVGGLVGSLVGPFVGFFVGGLVGSSLAPSLGPSWVASLGPSLATLLGPLG